MCDLCEMQLGSVHPWDVVSEVNLQKMQQANVATAQQRPETNWDKIKTDQSKQCAVWPAAWLTHVYLW